MASPRANGANGGMEVAIPAESINAATAGVQVVPPGVLGLMQEVWNGWFGPGTPLLPTAPANVEGRQFDFPFAVNLSVTRPKNEASESGVSFDQLRAIAEPGRGGLDLLRLAIETRKDQMKAQKWALRGREKNDDGGDKARALELVLRKPDGIHPFEQWLSMILEDHLVLDAVAIYPRKAGGRMLLEPMDAATLKLLADDKGRTPLPPLPAYQQVLKGLPAIDYTLEDVKYYRYNPRTNRLYGFSRVEQVVNMINLALRRYLHVLEFYTAGTIPDMFVPVPENWNPDQIKAFQTYWDAVMEGNTAARRHAKFIPGGMKPQQMKDAILKDEFDDWLARVICFAFSLSPQALSKQMNRATAETAKEASAEEGVEPIKVFTKNLVDDLLGAVLGAPELQFAWQDEEIQDPKTKAEVTQILLGGPGKAAITVDEARAMWSFAPATPEQMDELNPPPPPPPVPFGGAGPFGAKDPAADPASAGDPAADPAASDGSTVAAKVSRLAGGRSLHQGYPSPRSRSQ